MSEAATLCEVGWSSQMALAESHMILQAFDDFYRYCGCYFLKEPVKVPNL